MNRYLEHDEHIGAGSVEICRATFLLDARKKGEDKEKLISVEGKLDTCGSVSLSHSSHLQQVKDCRKYGLKGVVLSGIGGKSKPLREAGVLHVKTSTGQEKKILCYRYDERVGNTEQILLLSLSEDHQRRKHRHPSSYGPVAGWNLFSLVVFTG